VSYAPKCIEIAAGERNNVLIKTISIMHRIEERYKKIYI
jgi:hypothetical protein